MYQTPGSYTYAAGANLPMTWIRQRVTYDDATDLGVLRQIDGQQQSSPRYPPSHVRTFTQRHSPCVSPLTNFFLPYPLPVPINRCLGSASHPGESPVSHILSSQSCFLFRNAVQDRVIASSSFVPPELDPTPANAWQASVPLFLSSRKDQTWMKYFGVPHVAGFKKCTVT